MINNFNDQVIRKSYHPKIKNHGNLETTFYSSIPICKNNGMGRYSGDPREKCNTKLKDWL